MRVQRILFATTYGHLPDVVGGLQTTIHELCLALQQYDVEPAICCGYDGTAPGTSRSGRSDMQSGYLVVRSEDPIDALPSVAAAFNADVICVLTGRVTVPMIIAAVETNLPTCVYLHNVEYNQFGGVLLPDPSLLYFSNSRFTANRLQALFGIESEVLIPLVEPRNYRLTSSEEKVLFINPSHLKGVEILFQIVEALPTTLFRVAESWKLGDKWRNYCRLRATHLDNLEWVSSTRDMTDLYGAARLLLMPSIWEETYGRSVSEAQVSGIPVIASNRGGLPEAVGDGGIILDADGDIGPWIEAVRQVYEDDSYHQKLSAAARQHSYRKTAQPEYLVNKFMQSIQQQFFD